jgi:hypothetical protein
MVFQKNHKEYRTCIISTKNCYTLPFVKDVRHLTRTLQPPRSLPYLVGGGKSSTTIPTSPSRLTPGLPLLEHGRGGGRTLCVGRLAASRRNRGRGSGGGGGGAVAESWGEFSAARPQRSRVRRSRGLTEEGSTIRYILPPSLSFSEHLPRFGKFCFSNLK